MLARDQQARWDTVIHATTMKKTQEYHAASRWEVGGSQGSPEGVTPDCYLVQHPSESEQFCKAQGEL